MIKLVGSEMAQDHTQYIRYNIYIKKKKPISRSQSASLFVYLESLLISMLTF